MRIVAVFDTNILFSSLGWRGSPYRCLDLARRGKVAGVTCQELLYELAEKLPMKLGYSDEDVNVALADFLRFLRLVRIPGILQIVPQDPSDNAVLECAEIGQATHIVTGDRRHLLPLRSYRGMPILTATQFLTLVERMKTGAPE